MSTITPYLLTSMSHRMHQLPQQRFDRMAAAGNARDQQEMSGYPPVLKREYSASAQSLDNTQPALPVTHRKFANPAPLGLMGFATTTLILSLVNVGARSITIPNLVLTMAFSYGGLAQFMAGMWEFATGNTFGATAFTSYGTFWFSFAQRAGSWPDSGVLAAYTTNKPDAVSTAQAASQLNSILGIWLASWFTVTCIFLIASLRSSGALVAVFTFLTITFLLLFSGHLCIADGHAETGASLVKGGGAVGVITALVAYYTALAGLLTPDTSYFTVPVLNLSRKP